MKSNVHSRLLRLRAKVPMYRLFVKIFLWFWLAMWGILAIVFLSSRLTGMRQVVAPSMYATVAPILAAEAVNAYETGGPKAFARFSQRDSRSDEHQLYLLDGFYKDVHSRPITDDGLRVARAAKSGQLVIFRGHIAAYKFISSSGHPYIMMLNLKSGLRAIGEALASDGGVFSLSLFLLVTLLCFWLAYHIASPIHSIQSTARMVAQGDLKARVPSAVSKRHDELAALAIDFDSMVDRLEVLIRTQKDLLSSVSHEVRSPLARINLSLAILKKRSSAPTDDVFQRLESDVNRIDLLMGQLLLLSRLEAGLSSADRDEVNLGQIVEEVTADGNFEAQASGKSVSLQAADSVSLQNADPHALRSACENIIRNAIRYTRPGTDVQVVLAMDKSTLQPVALLFVRDFGSGVPEEFLQAIFQPFVQVPGDKSSDEGNGLGLAIALEAIRMHGGTISAANLPSGGLEICVRLPAVHPSAAHASEPSKARLART
jgi:two-component system, OmpR family, sensor histidine kinase CpxA